jgi:hypothetical protein
MPHLMGTKSAAGRQIGSDARGLGPGRGHPRVMKDCLAVLLSLPPVAVTKVW